MLYALIQHSLRRYIRRRIGLSHMKMQNDTELATGGKKNSHQNTQAYMSSFLIKKKKKPYKILSCFKLISWMETQNGMVPLKKEAPLLRNTYNLCLSYTSLKYENEEENPFPWLLARLLKYPFEVLKNVCMIFHAPENCLKCF